VESSYEQRYKILAKKGNVDVIIHFWLIPKRHFFFFQKKIKIDNMEKASRGGSQTYGKIKLQF
jgi:hypothetical protein